MMQTILCVILGGFVYINVSVISTVFTVIWEEIIQKIKNFILCAVTNIFTSQDLNHMLPFIFNIS